VSSTTFAPVFSVLTFSRSIATAGIAYLCTRFYTRSELSFRIGVFLSLGPGLSGAFGGLLAAGFLSADVNGLHTWQKVSLRTLSSG